MNGLVTNVHALIGHYFCLSNFPVRTVYFYQIDCPCGALHLETEMDVSSETKGSISYLVSEA
jgi:hypothetical protein